MNTNSPAKHKKHQSENGQALVISAGILFVLAITFMLYMSIQRAYNLANYLDETAELAAQSAAEPVANDLVQGNVIVNAGDAEDKAQATVELLASLSPEIKNTIIRLGDTTTDPDILQSSIKVDNIRVINPGVTLEVRDPICAEFNADSSDDLCSFPIVIVDLSLPHTLFGIDFVIRTRGVATLGANSEQPEAVPVTLPAPTALPTAPPIVVTVDP